MAAREKRTHCDSNVHEKVTDNRLIDRFNVDELTSHIRFVRERGNECERLGGSLYPLSVSQDMLSR